MFALPQGGYPPPGPAEHGWLVTADEKGWVMSATDKFDNKAENVAGKAKEKVGEVTGDQDKKNEGKADQVKSNLKDAGEKVKDAFRD